MPTIRTRGRLPHWEAAQATYAVVFRLADSLPKAVLKEIEFERQDILQAAHVMGRELSARERKRLEDLFTDKIESFLDAGAGSCFLANPAVAKMTSQALRHFDGDRYHLFVWCVMPNHVHVVFRPLGKNSLSQIVHSWKSFSAKEANRILKRSGKFWQHEYYDHLIQDEMEFSRTANYVLKNPQMAGLQNWLWVESRLAP
ncbi:MAG: transposase [Candidatus Acidiferrales bacterium]